MAWTSKVANVIKGRIGSAIAGAVGNKIMNSFASQGQTSKVAAKLLNKSPLEIGNNSPTAHMLENPYQYGTVFYPQETSNLGDGHYVIFDILAHKRSRFKNKTFDNGVLAPKRGSNYFENTGAASAQAKRIKSIKSRGIALTNRVKGVNSGIFSKAESNHTYVTDSILLYMPPEGMKFSYNADYEALETGVAGDFAQGLMGLINADNFEESIKSIGKGLSGITELTKMAGFGALAIIPGFENARGLYDKFRGQAKNPNLESVFKSVPFREFNFPFTFAPKNEKEKDSVHKILQLFRFHMLPQHKNDANGYFDVPSEFQITYMYRDNENAYLPKVSRCVLKNCEINYAPDNVVSTLTPDERGAPPTITTMNLTFGETEIMTKETVAQGY